MKDQVNCWISLTRKHHAWGGWVGAVFHQVNGLSKISVRIAQRERQVKPLEEFELGKRERGVGAQTTPRGADWPGERLQGEHWSLRKGDSNSYFGSSKSSLDEKCVQWCFLDMPIRQTLWIFIRILTLLIWLTNNSPWHIIDSLMDTSTYHINPS